MKEKIVGLLVCMLLIATAIPAVTSLKTNSVPSTSSQGGRMLDLVGPATVSYQNWNPNHPLTPTGGIWTEGQKMLASDGKVNTSLGTAI